MTQTERSEALLAVLIPYVKQMVANPPEYGEFNLSAVIHDYDVVRVRVGTEVSRVVTPKGGRP